jgi:hypothetical protein
VGFELSPETLRKESCKRKARRKQEIKKGGARMESEKIEKSEMNGKDLSVPLVHVTMHIVSRRNTHELKADESIKGQVDVAMKELMQKVQSGNKLAKRLSIPSDAHIQWNVEIAALPKGLSAYEGHIPIMVSVAGVPKIMEKLRTEVMEEATNLLFKEIRAHSGASRDVAKALGYDTDKPTKFHVYLPHQVRVRASATRSDFGDCDCDCDCDCYDPPPVWVQGGWSKG